MYYGIGSEQIKLSSEKDMKTRLFIAVMQKINLSSFEIKPEKKNNNKNNKNKNKKTRLLKWCV